MKTILLLLFFTTNIYGAESLLSKLISPGPLSKYHAAGEELNCFECHSTGKGTPDQKCLKCHTTIEKSTYHQNLLKGKNCSSCHSEHKGRSSSLVKFNQDNFDHSLTGYSLEGKHADLKCVQCHTRKFPNRTSFTHVSKKCSSCHKKDNPHNFQGKYKKQDCSSCHSTSSFKKKINFNHDNYFKLDQRHEALSCKKCHGGKKTSKYKWKGKSTGCTDCHKTKDFNHDKTVATKCLSCHQNPHLKKFNKVKTNNCLDCHTRNSFKVTSSFNHSRSGFELEGKHKSLNCNSCHSKGYKIPNAKKSCTTCHKDPHNKKMGNSCVKCHGQESWFVTKNFHKNFKLKGIHLSLSCNNCHKENRSLRGVERNCHTCHQKDSPHQGQLFDCGKCHGEHQWEMPKFRHGMTSFPLRGAHRVLSCNECHKDGIYQGKPSQCIDCHRGTALTSPNHSSITPQIESCSKCHGQFQWSGAKRK
ncbi:MAG: hypothetical protein KAG61_12075 [Bacteriovoracaceae bacterium]|nr:hypothetical protein [Bacteriovoracaceae bacterium]